MTDLQHVFERQLQLQVEHYGGNPGGFSDEPRNTYIMWNVLALTDELHEALAEVGWKPWATSRHLNREAFKKELVDALHFFVNLCLAAQITADELINDYFKKAEINAKRQEDGYDGVTTKCPQCRRELDSSGCLVLFSNPPQVRCSGCGYTFTKTECDLLQAAGVPAPVDP